VQHATATCVRRQRASKAPPNAALTFSLDDQERQDFVDTQEKLKLRMRCWLGDKSAAIKSEKQAVVDDNEIAVNGQAHRNRP